MRVWCEPITTSNMTIDKRICLCPNLPGSLGIGMWIATCLMKAELLDASPTSYPVVYFQIIYPINTDILLNGALRTEYARLLLHICTWSIFSHREGFQIFSFLPHVAKLCMLGPIYQLTLSHTIYQVMIDILIKEKLNLVIDYASQYTFVRCTYIYTLCVHIQDAYVCGRVRKIK